jgi:hypothetical protein
VRARSGRHSLHGWSSLDGGLVIDVSRVKSVTIATSYTLKLHELSHVESAIVRWTGHDDLGAILRTWQRDAPVADERLTSALEVDTARRCSTASRARPGTTPR